MFNEEPAKESGFSTPAKMIAISAVLVLLGFGLCSIGGLSFEGPNTLTTNIGIIAFWGGVIGLVIGVFWWLFALASRS